eukprot:scaffold9542_cov92-Cylindrotheca_fusiformis.AAC.3
MVSHINDETTTMDTEEEVAVNEVKRKVQFAETVVRHFIPSHETYSEEERHGCWYTNEEKRKHKKSHYRTAERMEMGLKCKKECSYRGLEAWTTAGGKQANKLIHACIDAVMDEQDSQWELNCDDKERIAKASKSKSKKSVRIALKLARNDAKEAKKAVASMDKQEEEKEDCNDAASLSAESTLSSSTCISLESRRRGNFNEARKPRRRRNNESRRANYGCQPRYLKEFDMESGLIRIQILSMLE